MYNMKKNARKLEKLRKLESGKQQFNALPRPLTTYVFVNNVSIPVALV